MTVLDSGRLVGYRQAQVGTGAEGLMLCSHDVRQSYVCWVVVDTHQCCCLMLMRFNFMVALHACLKVWDVMLSVMQGWPSPVLREG